MKIFSTHTSKGDIAMNAPMKNHLNQAGGIVVLLAILLWLSSPLLAKDTDIYAVNTKQNAYVLMDSSESMNFGVYEHSIDYGAMFDYLFTLYETGAPNNTYIYDTVNDSAVFYGNHLPARKIYLWKGRIGVTIATVDEKQVAFTGDAADPDYLWFSNDLVDTHTLIDIDGNLSEDDDGIVNRRITEDADGYILLDGARLPLGLDIKAHDFATLYNGAVVDNGFNGLLNAPGYYFSGYEGVAVNALNMVENGDQDVYFFVTGNWANMQAMYNLHYKTNNPVPQGAQTGDAAWPYEHFPITTDSWLQSTVNYDYPAGTGNYGKNLAENSTALPITSPGAQKIQIHFSAFDVKGDSNAATFGNDYVALYNQAGTRIARYDNDNNPASGDGWSPVITGTTATLKLKSDSSAQSTNGTGYIIDKIRVVNVADAYLMQSRMNVAKDALVYVVDEFRGKMNWGFASFKADGAQVGPYLNPTDNDDSQRAAIITQINNVNPPADTPNVVTRDQTPLMGALQDVWEQGYYGRRSVLDSLLCRKNYVISMTDGYPSADTNANKITSVTFADWDNDKWTSDPYQSPTSPNFYDDVAHWMYTHSWLDKSEVTDPANSYVNVTTHHIAFGAKQPMLENAASESGGEYIVAYNKEQLVAAFYSLALMMSEAVSFTAPVVSVDAVNKIQSGDDLYMGLFLPQDSTYWTGNVKKFKMGDGSTERPKLFMIYDAANHEAIDSSGQFLDNTAAIWGDDNDFNDTDNYGAADIKEDGAGEVLLEDVQGFFTAQKYWNRPIYTWKNGVKVKFDRDNITAADLGVADETTRDKLINFIHGYTYDAVAATGAPLAVRDWILGPIVHSRPVVMDYFNTAETNLPLLKRFIVVGSNDGMLHVFDDTHGREVFAFIPPDILPTLQKVQANKTLYDTVDGLITLYRRNKNPKYLIFGERRGGGNFWSLDVSCRNSITHSEESCTGINNIDLSQWKPVWNYSNSEISQSWSEVKVASIPTTITTNGEKSYKDVAIFTGGYDPEEDNFPEPFTDQDGNGTPYADNGNIDNSEWSKTTASQDIYDDDKYNKYNPEMNESGRGIFVVDIDDPTAVTNVTLADGSLQQILPFSATYGAAAVTTGVAQKFPTMRFCFPASPSVVTGLDKYIYKSGTTQTTGFKENVLLSLYAVDVYANLFKTWFTFDVKNYSTETTPNWKVNSAEWKINKVFNANPGSSSSKAGMVGTADLTDQGRKAFYPPALSWGGSKGYFEAGNYFFPDVTFSNVKTMASLFFGTGDREHPKSTMIRNRFYALYDDSSVTATLQPPALPEAEPTEVLVTSAPYNEINLLNLTCDELGKDSFINSCYLGGSCDTSNPNAYMKSYLKSLLTDDAVYGSPSDLEYGPAHENDAKGWYIVLADQGKTAVCDHVTYPTTIDASTGSAHDNHTGEQILSQAILYYGTLYFTSYQASIGDPCHPQGNGFAYALNYLDGSATYNLNLSTNDNMDITDRYKKFDSIYGIPSGFTIVLRDGHAAAMASMGGAIIGPGPDPLNPYEIATPGLGLELFYWRDSNTQP